MDWFSRTKKTQTFGILDIGSGSVGGAIFTIRENGSIIIEAVFRKKLVFQKKPTFERSLASLLSTINIVLHELEKKSNKKIKQFHYFLSSPWYAFETRHILKKYDKDFLITKKSLNHIINTESKSFFNDASLKYKNYLGEKLCFVDVENMKISLNGYHTNSYLDKKVKRIEISSFLSVAAQRITNNIEKRIHSKYVDIKILKHTFTLSMYNFVQANFPKETSFVLIDISGEMTDISIVHRKVIMTGATFPIGKHNLIRKLSEKFKTVKDDAWSKFVLFSNGKLTLKEKKRVNSALSELSVEWTASFLSIYSEVLSEYSLPSTIYLVADDYVSDWFRRQIENDLARLLPNSPQLNVIIISKKHIEKLCHCDSDVDIDVFLMLEIFYLKNKDLLTT